MELELQQLDRRNEALRRRSPQRERRLLASLAQHGQQLPIIVVSSDQGPSVVDGFKRVRALEMLRRNVVLATSWDLPEPEALVLDWLMRDGEKTDALEEGWLLRDLQERFELGEAELATRFDRSKSWVSRRLALVSQLPAEIQEAVRRDELGAHAAMKYLVPLARANLEECVALTKALEGKKPTSRQVAALYTAVLASGAEARALVLRDPWLFLRAQEEARRSQEKDRTPAEVLVGELGVLGGVARRLHKRLRGGMCERLPLAERADVRGGLLTTRAEVSALFHRFEKELGDAGSSATHGDPRSA